MMMPPDSPIKERAARHLWSLAPHVRARLTAQLLEQALARMEELEAKNLNAVEGAREDGHKDGRKEGCQEGYKDGYATGRREGHAQGREDGCREYTARAEELEAENKSLKFVMSCIS